MTVLADVLREAAQRFGSRTALVHEGTTYTYAELDVVSDAVAAGLDVRAGELAAIALPNGAEFVVAYAALSKLGAIVTAVNARATDAERARILVRAQPSLVIDAPRARVDGVPPVVERTDTDAPEAVVFTSGTTGDPKGAVFCSRQIAAITEIDTGGVWGAGGPMLVSTGLAHVGFMTKLAGHLKAGATMHILTRWRASDALRIISAERIAYVGGVAAQVALMLREPDLDRYDLSAVRGLIVGAGPSPPALVAEARERFGAGYSIRYSSTESGGLGTLTAFDDPDEVALHTVGRPRPEVELRIEPDTGEIWLRSPAVMSGYWNDPSATARALDADGWLHTGDVGWVGEDGCLRISGRLSEMYIRGGYNVYPLEVEAVLGEHPSIAAVAVVPRPDDVMGEIGVAVVVPHGAPPTLDELRAFAAPRLASYKLPEALRVVDALPLTSGDKIDRRALRYDQ